MWLVEVVYANKQTNERTNKQTTIRVQKVLFKYRISMLKAKLSFF